MEQCGKTMRPPEWDSLGCPQRKQFQPTLNFHQWTAEAVPVRALHGPRALSTIERYADLHLRRFANS